ncbi:hypothetical protein NBRC116494_17920 [Aurantivibrio plasticivorans]
MKLHLVTDNSVLPSYEDELQQLKDHYHDYDPEEWDAQYERLTEIAVLEKRLTDHKQQLIRKHTDRLR